MAGRDLAVILLAWPIFLLSAMIVFNGGVQWTQTALYTLVIVVALASGAVAGVTVLGSGEDSSLPPIIFLEVGLGTLYGVISAATSSLILGTFFGFGVYLYAIASVSYILGMVVITTP